MEIVPSAIDSLELLEMRIVGALPAIGSGLAVILGFVLLASIARSILARMAVRAGPERGALLELGALVTFWGIVSFGLVTGLGTMGIDIGALVAGLGLTGFALGFALRDAVSNILAGILVMTYRPFRRGDHIIASGFEGRVIETNLRYTVVQGEARRHLIPNQILFSSPLTVIEKGPAPAARDA